VKDKRWPDLEIDYYFSEDYFLTNKKRIFHFCLEAKEWRNLGWFLDNNCNNCFICNISLPDDFITQAKLLNIR
jgi:hypothetical protein